MSAPILSVWPESTRLVVLSLTGCQRLLLIRGPAMVIFRRLSASFSDMNVECHILH